MRTTALQLRLATHEGLHLIIKLRRRHNTRCVACCRCSKHDMAAARDRFG